MRTGAPERSGKTDAEVEGQVLVTWAGSGIRPPPPPPIYRLGPSNLRFPIRPA